MNRVALYFDAAFTLIHPRNSVGEQYASVARRFGCNPDAERLTEHFHPAFQEARKGRQPTMIGDEPETRRFWRDVVTDIYRRADEKLPEDPYCRVLFDAFATAEIWSVYPDAIEALELVNQLQIPCGVLSNFDNRLHPLLKDLNMEPYFQTRVVSCDVAVEKPDPEIFRIAQEKLPAEKHVIFGDTLIDDIEGGARAGWIPIHIVRDQEENLIDQGNYYSVNSLLTGVEFIADEFLCRNSAQG